MAVTDKKEAVRLARELVIKLGKGDWTWEVWNNFGWHYKAKTKDDLIHIYVVGKYGTDETTYHCMIGKGGMMNIDMNPPIECMSKDPRLCAELTCAWYKNRTLKYRVYEDQILASIDTTVSKLLEK